MVYNTFGLEFLVMNLILGLFIVGFFLYIFLKVDRSIAAIFHAIFFLTLTGLVFYTFPVYIALVLAVFILTIAYTLLYDRKFYSRYRKNGAHSNLVLKLFLLVWIIVDFVLYYIH